MILPKPIPPVSDALVACNYTAAIDQYSQAIEHEPDVDSNYWYLGLSLLLQGQEFEAQAVWYGAGSEHEDIEVWTNGLLSILRWAVDHQLSSGNIDQAWLIRRYIREFCPEDINNALNLLLLAEKADRNIIEELSAIELVEQLKTLVVAENQDSPGSGSSSKSSTHSIDQPLLFEVLTHVLEQGLLKEIAYEFADVASRFLASTVTLVETLLGFAIQLAYDVRQPKHAIFIAQICLRLNVDNLEILRHLSSFYQNARQYQKGIEAARQCYELSTKLPDKIFANHLLLRGLTTAGFWGDEVRDVSERHYDLVHTLMQEYPTNLDPTRQIRLYTCSYELPYLSDQPERFRALQHQLTQLCQDNEAKRTGVTISSQTSYFRSRSRPEDKPLTIGYISHCFGKHSVGWLARWLIQHHDRDRFKINGYFLGYRQGLDELQEWYITQFSESRVLQNNAIEIAQQIQADEVDILIELESLTLDTTCRVMALKPAPIQATWLGWDASGIPAIDYFIADPYVLPENAQGYYKEKIWRLPQTYLAIDGFEVAVSTLRREHLDIPPDAVIYFSSQRGFKRHPETIKLQMQILKEVPKSYFLVKGDADEEAMKVLFGTIAEMVGISPDRVKFLPWAASEAIHRANMAIADVVLDTYPYNGATTTMETLWMGIPLVTKVGQQFAARNSYTMMVNAGIEEGIAWTDEEYVEWGIQLGMDEKLRQDVHWKLMRSRQTASLWNAKKFTRDMEEAYQQMWAKHLESQP